MRITCRLLTVSMLVFVFGMLLAACPGSPRYSDDPAAARIQALTDFCIGYGALRDAATNFIDVDVARTTPVLTVDMVNAFGEARAFIKPFCSPSFDPQGEAFSLDALQEQLKNIRIILLKRENA